MIETWANIDTTKLTAAFELAIRYSTRAPEKMVRDSAFYVAVKAQNLTPFVSQATIDTELGTLVTPRMGKRGQPLSQKYAKNKTLSSGRRVTTNRGTAVPLMAMIIQASVIRPDVARSTPAAKRYNQLTHFRWARISSPFRGVSRAAGAAAMRAAVDRAIKSRHSSTHFLAAGWVAVCQKLRAYRYGGAPALDVPAGLAPDASLGTFTVTGTGAKVTITIENLVGMLPGARGNNSENYNRALHQYGAGPLQQAVDEQARNMFDRYLPRMQSELAAPFNALAR